jgi:multidrug efflux pump subunit AcrA (membrane-fusion protein)
MTIKAAADGIVYYGRSVRGQWATAAAMAPRLQRGGMLQPEEVLLTIVQPRPLFVRAEVEEKHFAQLRPGLAGKILLTANPDLKLSGKLESLSAIPVAAGKFEARVAIDGGNVETLVPGMACSVKFVPYVQEQAMVVPASTVFTEELDEDKHYVYLPGKEGKPQKRSVTLGKKTEQRVEIVSGLQEGDEILLQKPAESRLAATGEKGGTP